MNQKVLIKDSTSRQQIVQIYTILENALYSFEVYRKIKDYFDRERYVSNPYEDELWSHIANDCLQMGIVQWTKVFGSADNNQVHYSLWICQRELIYRLKEKSIDAKKTYDNMTRFRNKYVAHKDLESVKIPFIDDAIQTIYVFDNVMRERYNLEWLSERSINLESTHEAYKIRIESEMEALAHNGMSHLFVD